MLKIGKIEYYFFEWGELYYEELTTTLGCEAIEKISDDLEKLLTSNRIHLEKEIKKRESEVDPEYVASYLQHHFQFDDWLLNEIEVRQRYSNVLLIFSFFEGRLKSLCELVEEEFKLSAKLSDLNGNDKMVVYWRFLRDIFSIETNKIEPFFTRIKQQKIIRNTISHQNGILFTQQKEGVNNAPDLYLNGNMIQIKGNEYSLFLVGQIKSFFKEMYIAVDQKYRKLQKPQVK